MSDVTALPLSPSHSAVMPSAVKVPVTLPVKGCVERPQSTLLLRLRANEGKVSSGADILAGGGWEMAVEGR